MVLRGASLPTGALALTCLALAGCGSSSAPSSSAHAKTASAPAASTATSAERAFATHAGLAFGAFYHFIYAPYASGALSPATATRAVLTRATLAATYVDAQVEQATAAAGANPALAKLIPPMELLDRGFRAALVELHAGHFKLSQIQAANLAISAIKGSASNAGMPIAEVTPSSI
jgi:hypothetical protein